VTEVIKWYVHTKNVSSKLIRSYYLVQSLKGITSANILRSMYFANFHLQLRYDTLFGEAMGKLKKINKLQ
jgi:hypothetical protein